MSPERSLNKAISEEYSYGNCCVTGSNLKKGKKNNQLNTKKQNIKS